MPESLINTSASVESQTIRLIEDGKVDEAAKLSTTALSSARKAFSEDAKWLSLLLVALESQGEVRRAQGELKEAERLFSEALEHADSPEMPDSQRARLRTALATTVDEVGREADAMPIYEMAIAELEALEPPNTVTSGQLRNNLAMNYKRVGKFALAEQHYLRSVEIMESLHGRESEESASLYNNLGGLYYAAGFPDQAKEMFIEALDIRQAILDKAHPDIAQSLSNLAIACHELGDNESAQKHYEESLSILESHLKDPGEARSYDAVGNDYIALLSSIGESTKAATFQKRMTKALSSVA
jgi:tetratricopeptide (TPR) repeat protein